MRLCFFLVLDRYIWILCDVVVLFKQQLQMNTVHPVQLLYIPMHVGSRTYTPCNNYNVSRTSFCSHKYMHTFYGCMHTLGDTTNRHIPSTDATETYFIQSYMIFRVMTLYPHLSTSSDTPWYYSHYMRCFTWDELEFHMQ